MGERASADGACGRFMATQHGMLAAQKTGAGAGAGGQSRNPFVHPEVVQPPIVEENLIEI